MKRTYSGTPIIHYNPAKHSLVQTVEQWPWSTYHKYVASGHYVKQFYTDLQNELNAVIYDL